MQYISTLNELLFFISNVIFFIMIIAFTIAIITPENQVGKRVDKHLPELFMVWICSISIFTMKVWITIT
jgi:hypothetical protein